MNANQLLLQSLFQSIGGGSASDATTSPQQLALATAAATLLLQQNQQQTGTNPAVFAQLLMQANRTNNQSFPSPNENETPSPSAPTAVNSTTTAAGHLAVNQCTHCHLVSKSARDHLHHLVDVHAERIAIQYCADCPQFAARNARQLQKHQVAVHRTNATVGFDCDQCQFRTAVVSEADDHRGWHGAQALFVCRLCNYAQNTVQAITHHFQAHHHRESIAVQTDDDDPTEVPDSVQVDGEAVDRQPGYLSIRKYLSEHDVIESPYDDDPMHDTDVNARICSQCGYQGKWISEMLRHKRVHMVDRPFRCKFCTRTSKWKADLIRHVGKVHGICVVSKYSRSKTFDSDPNVMRQLKEQHGLVNEEAGGSSPTAPAKAQRTNSGSAIHMTATPKAQQREKVV